VKREDLVDSLGGLVLGSLVEGTGGVTLEASQLVLGSLLGALLGAGTLLIGVVGGGGTLLLGALVLRLGGLTTGVGGRHCCRVVLEVLCDECVEEGGTGVLKVFWGSGIAVSILKGDANMRQELTVGLKRKKEIYCSSEMFVDRREKEQKRLSR